jgi:hypothetical protein
MFAMVLDLAIEEASGAVKEVQILQVLRIFRLFKLFRLGRLLIAFPELVSIIKALVQSVRAAGSTFLVVVLLTFIWGIAMRMILKKEVEFNEHLWDAYLLDFSSTGHAMWTLVMAGALTLDGAANIMTDLVFGKSTRIVLAGICFLVYMAFTALVILQMLIGLLSDVVRRVMDEDKNNQHMNDLKNQIEAAVLRNDSNNDSRINQTEFLAMLQEGDCRKLLNGLKINVIFLIHMVHSILPSVDATASVDEIVDAMMTCRGEQPVTVATCAGGFNSTVNEIASLRSKVDNMAKRSMANHSDLLYDMVDDVAL